MKDHIPDAAKMVPDGFYSALVQCDTGGEIYMHIRIRNGLPETPIGRPLRQNACREITPITTATFCWRWSAEAAAELDALRTENAGLVKRVKELEAVIHGRDLAVDDEINKRRMERHFE